MIWNRKKTKKPIYGDTRVIKKFLWFPLESKVIKDEHGNDEDCKTCWMESAYVFQSYGTWTNFMECDRAGWKSKYFLEEDDYELIKAKEKGAIPGEERGFVSRMFDKIEGKSDEME